MQLVTSPSGRSLSLRWCGTCAEETPHERPDGELAPALACTGCGTALFVTLEPVPAPVAA